MRGKGQPFRLKQCNLLCVVVQGRIDRVYKNKSKDGGAVVKSRDTVV